MLTSDKFYRSFVLLPCEICVVPFGHRKIAADWNDMPLAKMKTEITHYTCLCVALLLQAWLSMPPKILPDIPYTSTSFKSSRCRLYCIIVESIPPKILSIRSHFRRKLHHIDFSRRKLVTNRVSLLSRNAGKPAFRHASPQSCLCVAKLL